MLKIRSMIKPVIMSLIAVAITTAVLMAIDARLQPRHLMIGYLLPVTLIAMRYGSISAVLTATASGLAAAFFCYRLNTLFKSIRGCMPQS